MTDEEIEKHICELLEIQNVHEMLKYSREIQKERLLKLRFYLEKNMY